MLGKKHQLVKYVGIASVPLALVFIYHLFGSQASTKASEISMIKPAKTYAWLLVRSHPWSKVELDTCLLQQEAPFEEPICVSSGSHSIKLISFTNQVLTEDFSLKAGETVVVEALFKERKIWTRKLE